MAAQTLLEQITEAISALSVPVGAGIAGFVKWRTRKAREQRAHEERLRISAEKTELETKRQYQALLDRLLKEKDDRIASLEEMLSQKGKP